MCSKFFDSIPTDDLRHVVASHLNLKRLSGEPDAAFMDRLTPQACDFLMVHELDNEVKTGGFNQYFFNTNGKHIDRALKAVNTICGAAAGSIVEATAKHYRLQHHIHDEARASAKSPTDILKGFLESFDSIDFWEEDNKWYEIGDEVDASLIKFLKTNKSLFVDSAVELEISDWLKEPDKYVSSDKANEISMKALKSWKDDDPVKSKVRHIELLLDAARNESEKGKHRDAEEIIREALSWLKNDNQNQQDYLVSASELLTFYSELLNKMDRKVQANAVLSVIS